MEVKKGIWSFFYLQLLHGLDLYYNQLQTRRENPSYQNYSIVLSWNL
jgi:hypothetical protein